MNATQILQIIVALGLLNVWLLRFGKSTAYRGGNAKNLKEEFAAYGLPPWFHIFIGILKVGSAIALIAGIVVPEIVLPAALLVCGLMVGALAMHLKISDPLRKSLPAFLMLVMVIAIVAGANGYI